MHLSWKAIGNRVRISNWPPMVWAAFALILVCAAGTAIVAVELYSVTGHPAQFSTK